MSKRYFDNLMCATFNMNDPEWIQKKMSVVDWCKQEFQCQGGAIICLGHVARMHGVIDKDIILAVLHDVLKEGRQAELARSMRLNSL